VFAAALARVGTPVTLCVRTPFDHLEVTDPSGVTQVVAAAVVSDPAAVGPVPVAVVATKASDSAGLAPWLARLCDRQTLVVVAQNGLDRADAVRPLGPSERVVAALVYLGAERVGPGRIVHFAGDRVELPAGPDGDDAAHLLRRAGFDARTVPDFTTAQWRKLLANAAANPITALTLRRTDVFREPDVAALAAAVIEEVAAVGRAAGAALTSEDVARAAGGLLRYGDRTGSSMLYDRLAGRPMEWDGITGTVVRRAARLGVDAPLNGALLTLLRAADGAGAVTVGPLR
jgi:2-dehydropantoate 2-reductase